MLGGQTLINKEPADFKVVKIVGLISDTHVPKQARSIPKRVFEIFDNADYIIHAGDLVELAVIDELEQIAPVLAVHGNMDGLEVINAFPTLNSMKVFGWKIGVMHDPDISFGLNKSREIVQQNGFNVFVCGHTHTAFISWEEKILYVNPGSATDPKSPFNKPSVGLLKITNEAILPQIIEF
jgi:putative phosphoesterase